MREGRKERETKREMTESEKGASITMETHLAYLDVHLRYPTTLQLKGNGYILVVLTCIGKCVIRG